MNKENMQKVVIAIADAYKVGNKSIVDRVEAIVLDNLKLPEKLQEVYDNFGSTPIEEPEFHAVETVRDARKYVMKDLDIDEFSAADVSTLANAVYKKVDSFTDKEGYYKTTPKIDKMKLPTITQLETFLDKYKKLEESGADENTLAEESDKALWKMSGLKKDKLTEWEQRLVSEVLYGYMTAISEDTVMNASDYTPFAKYIKN